MTTTRHASLHIERKSLDAEGTFIGYASTFDPNEPDLQGDVVAPTAFDKSLEDWRRRGSWPPLIWNHDVTTPGASLGVITDLHTDRRGLVVEGRLDLDHEPAVAVYKAMRSGRVKAFSIAYAVYKQHTERNWNVLDEVALLEISVTNAPANRNAELIRVKAMTRQQEYRDRAGHRIPAPTVLVKGTFPASKCTRCGSVVSFAPSSVSDTAVRAEIKRIEDALTGSKRFVHPSVKAANDVLNRLALPYRTVAEDAVDRFVEETREIRRKEREEEARLAEAAARTALPPGLLIPGAAEDAERETEQFARTVAEIARRDQERAAEADERARAEDYQRENGIGGTWYG